ncbi:ubiquitin carboxyl-terminal hydrolase UCHL3, partial [Toxoplasma gondii TgCatPRC2]
GDCRSLPRATSKGSRDRSIPRLCTQEFRAAGAVGCTSTRERRRHALCGFRLSRGTFGGVRRQTRHSRRPRLGRRWSDSRGRREKPASFENDSERHPKRIRRKMPRRAPLPSHRRRRRQGRV